MVWYMQYANEPHVGKCMYGDLAWSESIKDSQYVDWFFPLFNKGVEFTTQGSVFQSTPMQVHGPRWPTVRHSTITNFNISCIYDVISDSKLAHPR